MEALRSGNIILRIHAWQRMSVLLPSLSCWTFCKVTLFFYTTGNIPWGVKDNCYLPTPDFHCKPKYSLTKISEKSWDSARSEFKDQEQGKIPVSCTILNHSYSHCRSSGNSCVALKGWISYPVSINQNFIHGRESLDTSFLPCVLES